MIFKLFVNNIYFFYLLPTTVKYFNIYIAYCIQLVYFNSVFFLII